MTIAQQLREEGRKEGREEGVQKGVQQGEATILKHLLQQRFGKLSSGYTRCLNNADTETLLYWSGRILSAATIEEVFDK